MQNRKGKEPPKEVFLENADQGNNRRNMQYGQRDQRKRF